jgi:hypothetical protein
MFRPSSAGSKEPGPPLAPEHLADALKARPSPPLGHGRIEPDAHQTLRIAQVRDLYLDPPEMVVVRDRVGRG